MHISIDYETRSRCDLKKAGGWAYSQHPSTEMLCFAYRVDEGPVGVWRSKCNPNIAEDELPEVIREGAERQDTMWHAWNSPFEYAIWHNAMMPYFRLPSIPISQWSDTAVRAAAMSLPRSLDGAAAALHMAQQKDDEGHQVMLKLSKPRKPSKNDPSEWFQDPTRFNKLYDYCMQDVLVESEIMKVLPQLHWWERALWEMDQTINLRGAPIDVELAQAAIRVSREYVADRQRELQELTNGELKSSGQSLKLVEYLAARGVNISNVTADEVKRVLPTVQDPTLRRILEIRKETSSSSIAKYQAMINMADSDGRARNTLQFYGANTGRWAGRGIQLHNLPRKSHGKWTESAATTVLKGSAADVELIWGDVSDCLVKLIRSTICASPGKMLAASDYSQIESRGLCWCAGQEDMLEVFRRGEDVYKVMAGKIYGISASEATDDQRQRGKVAVLGLGYGMGAGRFVEAAAQYGIDMEPSEAERIVGIYRESHSAVTSWWRNLNRAAVDTIRTGKPHWAGPVVFGIQKEWLRCQLPSGRCISYYEPKIKWIETQWGPRPEVSYMGVNQDTKKWVRLTTWGGKLAENIVQAISRDLLAGAMLNLEKAGYEVVVHVHDEVVLEVPDGTQIEPIDEIMAQLPAWAKGLPLGSKGHVERRYRK